MSPAVFSFALRSPAHRPNRERLPVDRTAQRKFACSGYGGIATGAAPPLSFQEDSGMSRTQTDYRLAPVDLMGPLPNIPGKPAQSMLIPLGHPDKLEAHVRSVDPTHGREIDL